MSNANHLQQTQLSSSAISCLNEFAEWLYTARFQDEGKGSQRCVDPDLSRKIDPLLTELGIHSLVGSSWRNPAHRPTDNGTSLMDKLGDILFGASLVSQEHDSEIRQAQHTSTLYVCTKTPLQLSQIGP
jgi:hypothetical protein